MLWRSCGLLLSAKEDPTCACAYTHLPAKSTRQLKDTFTSLESPQAYADARASASKTCNMYGVKDYELRRLSITPATH